MRRGKLGLGAGLGNGIGEKQEAVEEQEVIPGGSDGATTWCA